jgi:peptidoglycan/LPS O-acetylase OafA/YrhL
MKLSDYTHGRDNNFNIIRMGAAFAVLVTHSFVLVTGKGDAEPFRESLGMTMGTIAVDVFFVTSGFLVTASLLTRQSVIEFVWARVLRIFPALLAMLLLTVFGLGAFFTSLPLLSYLADSKTYYYLFKCATLITGVTYDLPGVFDGNPYKNAVNGSLWSLPVEVRMYAILAIAWIALRIAKGNRLSTFKVAIVASAGAAAGMAIACHFYLPAEGEFAGLFFMFFSGAAFYVLRQHITLSHWAFWLFIIALLGSALTNKHAFFVVFTLTIAYVLFYIAYVPSGWIRKYNRLGDYSYGVYIYAFLVQQSVAALVPGVSVLSMLMISAFATIFLAVLSYHIIERRALGLKGLYVGHTRKMLGWDPTDTSSSKP